MDNKYYKQAYEEGFKAFQAEGVKASNSHWGFLTADFPDSPAEKMFDGWNPGRLASRRDAEGAHERVFRSSAKSVGDPELCITAQKRLVILKTE